MTCINQHSSLANEEFLIKGWLACAVTQSVAIAADGAISLHNTVAGQAGWQLTDSRQHPAPASSTLWPHGAWIQCQ